MTVGPHDERIERIPPWIHRAVQDVPASNDPHARPKSTLFEGVFWNPQEGSPEAYVMKHPVPEMPKTLLIYEAHGM
jgi:hypothetical protein